MFSASASGEKSIYEIFHCVTCVSKRDYRGGAREGFGHYRVTDMLDYPTLLHNNFPVTSH